MDEEGNVTLCITAIVIRKSPHYLILVLVVFVRINKDKDAYGSRTFSPIARVRPCYHVDTFISARGNTHKNINITTSSNICYLIG